MTLFRQHDEAILGRHSNLAPTLHHPTSKKQPYTSLARSFVDFRKPSRTLSSCRQCESLELTNHVVLPPPILVDDLSSGSDSDYTKYWIDWFLNTKGNEYFCEVDEEYILDRFNLTGLNAEVQHYSQALDLITDNLVEEEFDEDMRDQVEKSARHLYGLIHARFVITSRGLAKMLDKYKKAEFGRCPRVLCHNQPLLPVGLSDVPHSKTVKLYCPKCEDIYSPKSSRHAAIDGAYYGTSFPHMLFQVYPNLMPQKSTERYIPRIFGFKVHEIAKVHRWQDQLKERLEDQTRQTSKEQHQ